MATMKTLNGYGFNATELNGKTSDNYLQLGDDETGSTGEAPAVNAGTFGGMTVGQFVDMICPVGSIYMSASATSPETWFGGTWESIGGRFLLGADATYAAGSMGGEATHTLTNDEMPAHRHTIYMYGEASTGEFWGPNIVTPQSMVNSNATDTSGGNHPHNNMPPYLAVYMWKRTA